MNPSFAVKGPGHGTHAICAHAQAVQEVKALRGAVTAREKERAERATLVQQEALNTRVSNVHCICKSYAKPGENCYLYMGGCTVWRLLAPPQHHMTCASSQYPVPVSAAWYAD